MFNGSNCDRKPQLSGILTEPLNPREACHCCAMLQVGFPTQAEIIWMQLQACAHKWI